MKSLWFDLPEATAAGDELPPETPTELSTAGWYSVHTASNHRAYHLYGNDREDAIENFKKAFGITVTQHQIDAHFAGVDYLPTAEDLERHDALNAPPPADVL